MDASYQVLNDMIFLLFFKANNKLRFGEKENRETQIDW